MKTYEIVLLIVGTVFVVAAAFLLILRIIGVI